MGYGDYASELDKLAHESGVASKVVFVPSKNQEELLLYTASADIGLIPYPYGKDLNTHFASPNKLYEFISAGVPILSNKLPFVCEVVEGNNFGVCADLQSSEGFARAINEFPWGKLKTFKENILRERRRFEWTAQAKRLLKIYTAIEATEGSETPLGQTEKYSSPRAENKG
jgi:glycosyltransferase involved in cell wall biosynthesis